MWKLTIKYLDGGKVTIKGKHKEIPIELASDYYRQYKCDFPDRTAIYQEYPLKDNEPMRLIDKILELTFRR